MEPRHRVDQTPPYWQGQAVRFSQQYRPPSTRQHWSILCLCRHYYSVGWTRVWFQIPRPARLFRRQCLLPDMTHHTGDQTHRLELQRDVQGLPNPGLHRDIPGRLSDGSGRPWDKPGVTATPEIPDHVLHSLDRHQWGLLREMCVRSTSPRLWIWMTRDPFPMTMTTRVNIRRSQQQYQIFTQAVTTSKGSFKSTPLRQNERPGRLCWTWAARRWLTESRGWTSRRFKTRWFSTARIAQGLKDDKEVEKTTLSETLNTASSTFKFFTVKQIFPGETYCLKVHRDALYVPNPLGDHGFSDNKAPFFLPSVTSDVSRHRRVGSEVRHLRLLSGLYGGFGNRRTLSQGWTF